MKKLLFILCTLFLFSCEEKEHLDYISIKLDTFTPVSGYINGRKNGITEMILFYNEDSSCIKDIHISPYDSYEFMLHNTGNREFSATVYINREGGPELLKFNSESNFLEKAF